MMMILLVGTIALIVYGILLYNQLVRSRITCEEALSGLDVALVKRYDTLTNIQETVKGYVKHEQTTLVELTRLRATMTLEEKAELADQYAQAQNRLMMLAEGYPQLQASANFLQLQETIADVEEHLQAARRAYNANVARYNEKLQMFPSSLIAGMIHAEAKAFFQAELDQRENVNVSF